MKTYAHQFMPDVTHSHSNFSTYFIMHQCVDFPKDTEFRMISLSLEMDCPCVKS